MPNSAAFLQRQPPEAAPVNRRARAAIAPKRVPGARATRGGLAPSRVLYRACSCDGAPQCASCEADGDRHRQLQRARASSSAKAGSAAPPSVYRALASPSVGLPTDVRASAQAQLGVDLAGVRVHTGSTAQRSAAEVGARAYTVGQHVVFGTEGFSPHSARGARLLTHELVHVAQQRHAQAAEGPVEIGAPDSALEREAEQLAAGGKAAPALHAPQRSLQRAETLGTKVTEPKGAKPPFKLVTGSFDGETFRLVGDGKTIVEAGGQSGHPNTVTTADAAACHGSTSDSYLNNPRYVGIKDKGPIPEGEYTFLHANMVTFDFMERAKMALAKPGEYKDPSGLDLHGDWGAARVALNPIKLVPARFCGSTSARSGFYLHGGIVTGSSGCIDIGNSAITEVVEKLGGYTAPVKVTVKYTKPPPSVGSLERLAGKFMYPQQQQGQPAPGVFDRLKSIFSDDQ